MELVFLRIVLIIRSNNNDAAEAAGRRNANMTELVLQTGRQLQAFYIDRFASNGRRLALVMLLALVAAASPAAREAIFQALSDAYLAVAVFVAGTLVLVYGAESLLRFDLGAAMARSRGWQPLIAAGLGALPGCGGAIVVVTQYVRGMASFGALISVLVATMGDAAFLLLAREPKTALLVIAISLVAGTITGMVVDRLHGRDAFRQERPNSPDFHDRPVDPVPPFWKRVWFGLLAPGVVVGLLLAFQVDVDALLGWSQFTVAFGVAGAALSLLMWALSRNGNSQIGGHAALSDRVVLDTNFVTAWVVMAFVAYELFVVATGTDVSALFGSILWMTPLIGILVGFIPGCGPQIVVTMLYLAGAIPLSAQLSNAIANDGDALFPAIALAPRAAIYATLYSAFPALIVGYGWFLLFE